MRFPRAALAWFLVGAGSATLAYPAVTYGTGALRQARLLAEVRVLLGPEEIDAGPVAALVVAGTGVALGPEPEAEGGPDRALRRAPAREPEAEGGPGDPVTSPPGRSDGRQGSAAVPPAASARTPPPPEGSPLGILRIDAVGLEAVVLEGVAGETLLTGPGHLPWTAPPGSEGVSVLAAHRDLHFRGLKDVPVGERVRLRLPGRSIAYRVTDRAVVKPDAGWVTAPRQEHVLRLVTCWPPNLVGPAPDRLVVTAVPIAPPAPGPVAPAAQPIPPRVAAAEPAPPPHRPDLWATPPPHRPDLWAEPWAIPLRDQDAPRALPGDRPDVGSPPARERPGDAAGSLGGLGGPVSAASLPWIGSAGATASALATFGAWRGRRRRLLWSLPWLGGLGVTAAVLLSS